MFKLSAATVSASAIVKCILNVEFSKSFSIYNARRQCHRKIKKILPIRSELIDGLQCTDEFDVLIIGGGATGLGCAVDAVTRGLKTALVELDDFSSGTSSKSTKLIHGGIRYLQKAILQRDKTQYKMVKEALQERNFMFEQAPHLVKQLPILIPIYEWWKLPYYWAGLKIYDLVAFHSSVQRSYFVTKKETLRQFPMLKSKNLCGGLVYHDGQQNDSRVCVALALTAIRHGAIVCNHVEAFELKKNNDKLCGARVKDHMSGERFNINARCVINATGPFTDCIRKMDDSTAPDICAPSCGVHIILPGYYSPKNMGLLDPATSDGRVIFFLPWQGHTIAGTTDTPCKLTKSPSSTDAEIAFLFNEIENYLNDDVEVRRGDMSAVWSGIRPLVKDITKDHTKSLLRNHIVDVSKSKLVTIAGGKWTTYREMAEHAIDAAIYQCRLRSRGCNSTSKKIKIEGAHNWTPTMHIRLVQDLGLDYDVAKHLAATYGDRAFSVAKLAKCTGKRWPVIGIRIHPDFPYIDGEIRYGIYEYACNAVDMIARRLRLAFLNVTAARESLPFICDIMAEELKWSDEEKTQQLQIANDFLDTQMGGKNMKIASKNQNQVSELDIQKYTNIFKNIDQDGKGYISCKEAREVLNTSCCGEPIDISGEQWHEILKEIDSKMNGQLDLEEFLLAVSSVKTQACSKTKREKSNSNKDRKIVCVENGDL